MKRASICLLLLLLISVLVCGCGETSNTEQPTSKQKTQYTAAEVLQAFKDANLPLGRVELYTAENDPNKLLGRPNQYTGKFNFEDSRKASEESDSLIGGSVEVFKTEEDLTARIEYIKEITKDMPMLQQYLYVQKNILLRIDYDLTPDQAKEYETVLKQL